MGEGTLIEVDNKGLSMLNNFHGKLYEVHKEESLEGNEIREDGILTDDGLLTGKEDADKISPIYSGLKDSIAQYSSDKSEKNLKENVETTFEKYEEIDFWGMVKEIKDVLKTTAIKIIKIVSGWFAGWVKSL